MVGWLRPDSGNSARSILAASILDDVDRDETSYGDWWLFQAMASGAREVRVELELGETASGGGCLAGREFVDRAIDHGGAEAIRSILVLLDCAPTAATIIDVGCGPLEDLVNGHGDALVEVLDQTARQRPDFAASLGSVAVEAGSLQPETFDRLARWLPGSTKDRDE